MDMFHWYQDKRNVLSEKWGGVLRLFYCPKCKKEEIRSDNPYRYEETIVNMRDGYGRPIRHYKCECGNYLAGSMDVNGWLDNPDAVLYCKGLIKDYNPGGCYYDGIVGLNGDKSDMYERAKKYYEDRKKRGLRRTTSILEQRMNGE